MPRGDRTGPAGMGPRSGRAAGYCRGFDAPGHANPGLVRGGVSGFGPGVGGRRRRRGFGGRGRGLGPLEAVEGRLAESDERKEKPE
jgi:hypothetical protein